MKLRTFSVAGEALNFGARRMATIMRVAWLPVSISLIANMALVFGALSVNAGRFVDFSDIFGRATFMRAQEVAFAIIPAQLAGGSVPMALIVLAAGVVNLILIASFMAPLIRLAGRGEHPAEGVVRAPFGPDQLRFIAAGAVSLFVPTLLILAPIGAGSLLIVNNIREAVTKTLIVFPDPDSLHTVELLPAVNRLQETGRIWIYEYGLWYAGAAMIVLVTVVALMSHFHPRNRLSPSGNPNALVRAVLIVGAVAGGIFGLTFLMTNSFASGAASGPAATAVFGVSALMLLAYTALRFSPYPGIAVCRKSMAFAGSLQLTRGWNIARMIVILGIIYGLVLVVGIAINAFVMPLLFSVVSTLFEASAVYTRLLNNGARGEWVLPLFQWLWTGLRILFTMFWTFFSYGVLAGFYGRLFRESERAQTTP